MIRKLRQYVQFLEKIKAVALTDEKPDIQKEIDETNELINGKKTPLQNAMDSVSGWPEIQSRYL